jgi:transcriptional regulator with XRE-family HTH domain
MRTARNRITPRAIEPSQVAQPLDPKSMLQQLGRRIRSLRDKCGLTQEEFAARCGISISFASLLERGERSPSYETLVHMATALEISLEELFRSAAAPSHEDPYYAKLVEFARRRKLTPHQLDRLIAVGQVVFDGRAELASRNFAKTSRDAQHCSADGCERSPLAKGLCPAHYHRARRAKR